MTSLLPARAPPVAGESLLSVVRRTAQAMGYDSPKRIVALLREAGKVPRWLNAIEDTEMAHQLAEMLGLTTSELTQLTIHRYSGSLIATPAMQSPPAHCDRRSCQQYFVSYPRVCPSCLSESAIPTDRILWSFRPVPICIHHGVPLVSLCPGCSPRHTDACLLNADRGNWRVREQDLPDRLAEKPVMLMKRIATCLENGTGVIPETGTAVSFIWLHQLALRVASCPRWLRHTRVELKIPASVDDATLRWILVADWPGRFFELLDSCHSGLASISHSARARHPFHKLHGDAVRLARRGHLEPARAFRDYLSDCHSNGLNRDSSCLRRNRVVRELLNRQLWLTHVEAATKLQVRVARVVGLIREGVLNGTANDSRRPGECTGVVSRESVDSLIAQLDSSFSRDEASALLAKGPECGTRICGAAGRTQLFVNENEIVAPSSAISSRRATTSSIPLNRLTKSLFPACMTSKRALRKWIEAGLLEATQTGCEWYVMAEDAARFRETYCIAAEAMRLLKRNRSTLTRWEAAGHLAPVDGTRMTRQVGFTLYQRADIQRLKDTTPMRRLRTAQSNNKNQSNQHRKEDVCI
jgi:hypothetical protein